MGTVIFLLIVFVILVIAVGVVMVVFDMVVELLSMARSAYRKIRRAVLERRRWDD